MSLSKVTNVFSNLELLGIELSLTTCSSKLAIKHSTKGEFGYNPTWLQTAKLDSPTIKTDPYGVVAINFKNI